MSDNPHTDTRPIALVDEQDQLLGYEDKLLVHQRGLLHRAFSVVLLNDRDELLLQQRAWQKYHSPGLWTNTSCSHGMEGEAFEATIARRLYEEMGIVCPLTQQFAFRYQVTFANGLIENEYDHVYLGSFNGVPSPNPDEVAAWKWMSIPDLRADLRDNGDAYTYWFKLLFARMLVTGRACG